MDPDELGFPPAPLPPSEPAPVAPPLPDLPPPGAQAPLSAPAQFRPRSSHGARAKAGLGAILAAVGTGVGLGLAGPLGGLTGLAGVGAARNLYRAQGIASNDPAERGDAARSLALGLIGLGIVGFLGYKIYSSSKDKD